MYLDNSCRGGGCLVISFKIAINTDFESELPQRILRMPSAYSVRISLQTNSTYFAKLMFYEPMFIWEKLMWHIYFLFPNKC